MTNFVKGFLFAANLFFLLATLLGEVNLFGRELGQSSPWDLGKILFITGCGVNVVLLLISIEW